MESDLERSNFSSSVLVKSPVDYAHRREAHVDIGKYHKSVTRQVRHERHRQNTGAHSMDWRRLLQIMAENTPEESLDWVSDGMKLEIPRKSLTAILKGVGDNKISSIRRRTGATIKISRDESNVLLSGTRRAINKATEEFRKIVGRMTITRLYTPLGPGEAKTEDLTQEDAFFVPPLSREEGAMAQRRPMKQHVYSLPIPLAWTPKGVEDFVAQLVDSVVERSLHAPLYGPISGEVLVDHERAVVRRLERLFQNVTARKVAPRSALKLALAYLCDKGDKYLPEARRVFVLMDQRGLPMDADVFNILLRAPVKTRDLHKFHRTVQLMMSRGHAPNLDTWLLLLRMFESVEVRAHVLQTMYIKNLLGSRDAIERVAEEMAMMDAQHAVVQGHDLPTFLREQAQRYGTSWLTRDAGNKILHVFGAHDRFDDAFALLYKMGEASARVDEKRVQERLALRPDTNSFNTIIARAQVRGKLPLAINVLRLMKLRHLARQPDVATLHMLFEMAWKFRMRASIVAIWRYTCLARLTSFQMRMRVASLLGIPGERVVPARSSKEGRGYITEPIHRALGGEALARELAGGREALQKLRAQTGRLWGDRAPPQKIATFAAKAFALAFGEFGPSVPLGEVLAQAMLVDVRCLREKKARTLRDALASARVKTLVLWRRTERQDGWVDLAPLDMGRTERITPRDQFADEWESEGWDVPEMPAVDEKGTDIVGSPDGSEGGSASEGGTRIFHTESDVPSSSESTAEPAPVMQKRIAIINPHVWVDDDDMGDGVPDLDGGGHHRTPLQRENEREIVAAMDKLRKNYMSFRYVLGDPDEDDEAGDMEHAMWGAEEDKVKFKTSRNDGSRKAAGASEDGGKGGVAGDATLKDSSRWK